MIIHGDCEILGRHDRFGERMVHATLSQCFVGDPDWLAFYGMAVRQLTWSKAEWDGGVKALVELDFLVFRRDRGCLLIEVKGGAVRCENGVWEQGHKGKWRPMRRHPLRQAEGALKSLLNRVRQTPHAANGADAMLHRALVLMPGIDGLDPLPADLSEEVVAFRAVCQDPGEMERWLSQRFERLALLHGGGCRRDATTAVLEGVVMPQVGCDFGLRAAAAQHAAQEAGPIVRPGRHDEFVRERLQRSRVLVEGAAGTGKSMVAAIRAARLLEARPEARALCIAYNELVAQSMSRLLVPHFGDRVAAVEYHRFCRERVEEAGLPWVVPEGLRARQAFFKRTAPELLAEAARRVPPRGESCFDLLVADEAQDLNLRWLRSLRPWLRRGALRWGFFDPQQSIFSSMALDEPRGRDRLGRMRRALESFFGQPDRMLRCCRMSRQIFEHLRERAVLPQDLDCDPQVHEGEAPIEEVVSEANLPAAVEAAATHAIESLGFSPQMVLVQGHRRLDSASNPLNGRLRAFGDGPYRIADLVSPDGADPFVVPYTTIQKFKGCERPCTIVIDSGFMQHSEGRDLLYTALTRARLHLHVLRVEG